MCAGQSEDKNTGNENIFILRVFQRVSVFLLCCNFLLCYPLNDLMDAQIKIRLMFHIKTCWIYIYTLKKKYMFLWHIIISSIELLSLSNSR